MSRLMKVSPLLSLLRALLSAACALFFLLRMRICAAACLISAIISFAVGHFFCKRDMLSRRGERFMRRADVFSCASLLICICLL